jgi:O-acetyl-ADP-ribose deacetylase (regulator of RNase III)
MHVCIKRMQEQDGKPPFTSLNRGSFFREKTMAEATIQKTRLISEQADITELDVDAFVFDIKSNLKLGSGFGGAIAVRGGPSVQEELDKIGKAEVGEAVITSAGNLKASFIIHAVGPKYQEEDEDRKMKDAVLNALKRADENQVKRIAFPPMGTGMYFFPLDKCARILTATVKEYLENTDTGIEEVHFCTIDKREYAPFARELENIL